MLKTKLRAETYAKIGHPDIGDTMYVIRNDKKIYGKVVLLAFTGFKNAKKGLVLLGIDPFKKK